MTTQTDPTRKLYKRCKRGNHAICSGSSAYPSGLVYSICECACHALSEHDTEAIVEAAQAIVTAPAERTEGEARAKLRKFAAKRAAAAAAFKPEPDGTYINHPARHEADYTLRGVKGKHAYGFFDPCDEHAIEENAVIIAYGRSEAGTAHRNLAANCIERLLFGCGECKERTRLALSTWARTQGDVVQPIAYNPPKPYKPTRMSRDTFIAKYADRRTVISTGDYGKGEIRSVIFRCANRDCLALKATNPADTVGIVLHDTDKLCTTCELNDVKPRKRRAA